MATRARTTKERREAAEVRRARRAEVTDPDTVMEAAANFLSFRSRSVEETRRRLRQLGYPPALCDQVVDRLVELRYLDDFEFARAWVESRDRARPRGEVALRRELQLKGIPADTIAEVLAHRAQLASERATSTDVAALDADRDAASKLIARRASALQREPDPRRRRQKAYALLARNGFAPDVCHEVASTVSEDGPE
jgi:SOS response regulatory protein OraA/RecX